MKLQFLNLVKFIYRRTYFVRVSERALYNTIMNLDFSLKWIAWESTKRCNLNCIHCRSKNGSNTDEIDTKKAFNLMDKVGRFSKPVFVISGGEPLLRKDIFELLEYGTKLGFKMAIATNGSLLDDSISLKLKSSGLKVASLSLDGSVSEVHDNFRRQPGSFDSVIKAATIFKKHNIPFLINSSFTKRNQSDIENTYKLAKKLGCVAWYIFIVVPVGNAGEILDDLISKEDYENILKWHFNMEISEKDIKVRPICAPSYYRVFHQNSKKIGTNISRRNLSFSPGGSKGCVAAQYIAYIDHLGNVYPCSYFPASAGNIFESEFETIWNSKIFGDIRNFSNYKGNCQRCEYLTVCGGCRVRALIYNGDYMAGDPYCDYKKL